MYLASIRLDIHRFCLLALASNLIDFVFKLFIYLVVNLNNLLGTSSSMPKYVIS